MSINWTMTGKKIWPSVANNNKAIPMLLKCRTWMSERNAWVGVSNISRNMLNTFPIPKKVTSFVHYPQDYNLTIYCTHIIISAPRASFMDHQIKSTVPCTSYNINDVGYGLNPPLHFHLHVSHDRSTIRSYLLKKQKNKIK